MKLLKQIAPALLFGVAICTCLSANDDYVPTNQSIPVSERRTLIAVGNTLSAAGMFIRRRED